MNEMNFVSIKPNFRIDEWKTAHKWDKLGAADTMIRTYNESFRNISLLQYQKGGDSSERRDSGQLMIIMLVNPQTEEEKTLGKAVISLPVHDDDDDDRNGDE